MSFTRLFSSSRSLAAFSKSWAVTAASFSFLTTFRRSSRALTSGAAENTSIRTLDAASSTTSIALSGKNRSVIYLLDKDTAAFNASSVILALWNASYRSRKPFRISRASSSLGSPT